MSDTAAPREIKLTRDMVALVDAADFDWLSKFKWHVTARRGNAHPYAQRASTKAEREAGAGKSIRMHRLLCECTSDQMVDHINGNTLDNRRENLRACSGRQNTWNSQRQRRASQEFRGVKFDKDSQKYVAVIRQPNTETMNIGYYPSAAEAALAYDKFCVYFRGEFAQLNFPGATECELAKKVIAERDELKANYEGACQTIALMHEAATGVRGLGPKRGVVEDVADTKKERDAALALLREAREALVASMSAISSGYSPNQDAGQARYEWARTKTVETLTRIDESGVLK